MQLRKDDCYAPDYIWFPRNTQIPRVEAENKLPGVCGYPTDSKARGPILFGGGIERSGTLRLSRYVPQRIEKRLPKGLLGVKGKRCLVGPEKCPWWG